MCVCVCVCVCVNLSYLYMGNTCVKDMLACNYLMGTFASSSVSFVGHCR